MTEPLLLRALRGEKTQRPPIWFMRQAGRFLPEYRAIKERLSFWEMARTPDVACEVTLQPVRRLGVDAAILFQDIMTPLPPMGVHIDFSPGPVIREPIRSVAAVDALRVPEQDEIAPYVGEAIRLIRAASDTPLIGFGGAPLTLATYLIEGSGSKEYNIFRGFLRQEPAAAHRLLAKLRDVSIAYLRHQVEAGAQAIQLFDSWAGLHDPDTFAEFAMPYNAAVLQSVRELGVPVIYLAVNSRHLFHLTRELPADAFSVDWRQSLTECRTFFGDRCVQGNLDPVELLASRDRLRSQVLRVLEDGRGGPHVFNLGHGMIPQIDPDAVKYVVDLIHEVCA
jgi:uroporphyrinogen decarboxylase